jgi:dipeptidyl aminopeptidase/acylaminoacyl peptidase
MRPIAIADLLKLRFVSDVQISPDGSRVCYAQAIVERDAEKDEDTYRSHLWIVAADGGEPRQFTFGPQRDSQPRWSPDCSQIAFVSDRGGDKHLWVIPADGGEARQVTKLKGGVAEHRWSPDGQHIAFVSRVGPDPLDNEPDREKAKRKKQNRLRVYTRIRYKLDGEGFWDGKWKQVFVVDPDAGEPRQLTTGDFDHVAPAWSPDNRWIAYVANPEPDADFTNVADVWVIPTEGGEPRKVTRSLGPCGSLAWSPDGRWIAYFGHDNEFMTATLAGVWTAAADGSGVRELTGEWDRSAGNHVLDDMRAHPPAGGPVWRPDGSEVLFLGGDGGTTQLYAVSMEGGVRALTQGRRVIYGYSFDDAARRAAVAVSTPTIPGDVYLLELGEGVRERRLTDANREVLSAVHLSEPEPAWFEGVDGWKIEGWILRPAGFREGERYPVVLQIHGGPHAAYGWSFFHEFQVLAASGMAVLYTNPRGSQGYGQAFNAATRNDWGGNDYRDLMMALDQALDRWPWLDRDRMGVAGGSYGGYMTNWVIGHTDRFRAAVTMRSIANCYSQWGMSDLAFMKGFWEFPGEPWDYPEFYLERSPITYVNNMRTPLLIIHSENDLRCSIGEAEQLFAALMKRGVKTVFLRFPNESHDLSRAGQPEHRIQRLQWIVRWLTEHLLEAVSPQPAAVKQTVLAGGDVTGGQGDHDGPQTAEGSGP